ncbi:MAG: META domain-containing protein [Dongiaceae bacterium]
MAHGKSFAAAMLFLAGCTATPEEAATLVGPVWLAEQVAGAALPTEPQVTLQFGADGRAAGKGGCNQYSGPYRTTGNGISFGAMISTEMACDGDVMEREQAYLDLLGRVSSYEVRNNAELILYADDGTRIRLRRGGEQPM